MVVTEIQPYEALGVWLRKHKGQSITQPSQLSKLIIIQKQRVDDVIDLFLSLLFFLAIFDFPAAHEVFGRLQGHEMVRQETADSWLMAGFWDDDASFLNIFTFLTIALFLDLILLFFLIFFIVFFFLDGLSFASSGPLLF